MAASTLRIPPSSRCLRATPKVSHTFLHSRTLTTTSSCQAEATAERPAHSYPPPPADMILDPNTVSTKREERLLFHHKHQYAIGSRRRRAAMKTSDNVPFEQMPYQCFQEARKILAADREDKLAQIAEMRKRIAYWQGVPAADIGGEYVKKGRLVRMQKYLEQLKILADSNDPVVKKRFEDGFGDMNRPIYRHLADRKWRSYDRLVLMQRIEQHHVVPDILPYLDPTASVSLHFARRNVQPGEFVDSRVSEVPARLRIQVFDKGERLVTIVVVDPDVPNTDTDAFDSRCHFLVANIPVSPTQMSVQLSKFQDNVVLPWLPAFAQKGAPYHRLVVMVLQQDGEEPLDVAALKAQNKKREGWKVKGLVGKGGLTPIGVGLFRTKWDEGTEGVMKRAGVEGAELEFVRKKPEKNLYKKKDGARYR